MNETARPLLSNKAYDVLKWIAQIGLPAAGALYFGLAQIWGLPEAEKVVGTITVVDAFLGVVLGISTISYNRSDQSDRDYGRTFDGVIVPETTSTGKTVYSLQFDGSPEQIKDMDTVIFRVDKSQQ